MAQAIQCAVWDITISDATLQDIPLDERHKHLANIFKKIAKKWAFQHEMSEGDPWNDIPGYDHWQCRVSLNSKMRDPFKKYSDLFTGHWTRTNKKSLYDFDYVTKEETRVGGPWTFKDREFKEFFVPRQIAHLTLESLWKWQKLVIESGLPAFFDSRTINVIVDWAGNHGKTALALFLQAYELGRRIPYCENAKDFAQMICCLEIKKGHQPIYCIDIPRALEKKNMRQFFAGIEAIKDGAAYDTRYSYQEAIFDSPAVWVFTNKIPEVSMLSFDRWVFWIFDPADRTNIIKVPFNELHKFDPNEKVLETTHKTKGSVKILSPVVGPIKDLDLCPRCDFVCGDSSNYKLCNECLNKVN